MLVAGARIAVYPNRARLTGHLLAELVVLVMMVGIVVVLHGDVTRSVFALLLVFLFGAAALLIAIVAALTAYRILVRKLAVGVSDEGIVDNCSLITTGADLLRWHEISAIFPYTYRVAARLRYLAIIPHDTHAVLGRRGLLARLFWHAITLTLPARTSIPEWMLSVSIKELCSQLRDQYGDQIALHHIIFPEDRP
jgi:hypothetical protein